MSEISLKAAHHVKPHILEIEFSDGHKQLVDFATFIFSMEHPDYEKYKSESNFRTFKIVDGNLN
ncbi:hypothetical protein A3224_00055 [Microbulbifer thermotolerans]|nr:hypothetical protein A3224_00055 [Microbulbifer thermotolerans]